MRFAALCLMTAWAWIPQALAQEPAIPAQLVAIRQTTLSSELAAKIDRIAVKEGERFKEGQVLVAFDCVIQRAQLDEAAAVLSAADRAKAVHKRLLELNSAGQLETEKAISDAAVAQAKVHSARAVLSKCAIQAPFPGRVVEQKAQAHQYVQAGQPILEILDDSAIEAEFIVPSSWVRTIKPGAAIRVSVEETAQTYDARIIRVGAKVDAASHSIKVVAELADKRHELMAGMTGKVVGQPVSP